MEYPISRHFKPQISDKKKNIKQITILGDVFSWMEEARYLQ